MQKLERAAIPVSSLDLENFTKCRNVAIPVSSIEREKARLAAIPVSFSDIEQKNKESCDPRKSYRDKMKKKFQVSKICDPRKFYRDKQKHNGRSLLYFVVIGAITVVGVGREENKPALQREAVKLICSV